MARAMSTSGRASKIAGPAPVGVVGGCGVRCVPSIPCALRGGVAGLAVGGFPDGVQKAAK